MREQIQSDKLLNFQHVGVDITRAISSLKIDYLLQERQRLEIEMNEIEMNNKMLRQINEQIFNNRQVQFYCILQRNFQLQDFIQKILTQNRELRADLFIYNQINTQNIKQQKQILQSYQQKINQMRHIIHSKQLFVQKMEENNQNKYYTPHIKRFQLLQELTLLRKNISQLNINNIKLTIQNKQLKQEISRIKQDLKKIGSGQIQHMDENQQGLKQIKLKTKMSMQTTSTSRNITTNFEDLLNSDQKNLQQNRKTMLILIQTLQQKNRQISILCLQVKKLEEKNKQNQLKIKIFAQSHKKSENKRKNILLQLNILKDIVGKNPQMGDIESSLWTDCQNVEQGKINIRDYWLQVKKDIQSRISYLNPLTKRSRSNSQIITNIKKKSIENIENIDKQDVKLLSKLTTSGLSAEEQNIDKDFSRISVVLENLKKSKCKKLHIGNHNIQMIENIFV